MVSALATRNASNGVEMHLIKLRGYSIKGMRDRDRDENKTKNEELIGVDRDRWMNGWMDGWMDGLCRKPIDNKNVAR